MSRPVLFVIDDDAGVVHALRDDPGRRSGEDFRVIGESPAAAGLAILRQLAGEHEPVALLIVDHDMTGMSGVRFLACAHRLHPLARRVLLVERDYSARSPVVQAMTLGQADYHLTRPWMLEQDLYREISEFLAGWAKDHQAGFELFHVIGGQAGNSPMIRNYPGFPHGISGHELTRRACEQAWMFGAHMVFSQPSAGLARRGGGCVVYLADGRQIAARAVIIAPGIAWRRLGVPRLEALIGSGVFYGAAGSETQAMEGRDVFVAGAGNSAGQTALHLARYARQVTMLVRGDSLARSMSDYLTREI